MDIISSILVGILLGLIQGVTEWLPVSSSGHLAAAQIALGYEPPVVFDLILHMGSVAVLILIFRKDVAVQFKNLGSLFILWKDKGFKYAIKEGPKRSIAFMFVTAMVPTAIIGLTFRELFVGMFSSLLAVGIAELIMTGVLIATYFFRQGKIKKVDIPRAFVVGIAQGIAVAPGISRSGSTIAAGMFAGLNKDEAARFSFLLAIPTLFFASLLEFILEWGSFELDPVVTIVGFLVSLVVSYLSIKFLLAVIRRGSLHLFAVYTFVFGLLLTGVGLYYRI